MRQARTDVGLPAGGANGPRWPRPATFSLAVMEHSLITVVLADDHILFREGTRELLERSRDIVVTGEASTGSEAVERVAALQPDVAIIDIEMPDVNGVEATRMIKARQPEVAVLVLTVHDEEPYVFAILEAGAAGYLLKDVHATELIDAVHSLHEGESVLHPAVAAQVLRHVRAEQDTAAHHPLLTVGEQTVLRLAAKGLTNKAIAGQLGLHPRTVQLRLSRVFQKMQVGSRTEAVLRALRDGLFTLEELT